MKQTKSQTRRRPKRASVKVIKPNDQKFRELLLFIAERSENDPQYGAIKLNKLLFYSDFLAYLKLGKPITGQEYFALRQGPAPRYGTRIREEMIAAGEIALQKKERADRIQTRTVALRPPNYKVFSSEEIALVTQVLQDCRASSGSELSEKSHKFAGWSLAKEKETIPYAVALVGNRLPTHDEIQHGVILQATAEACLAEHAARGNA
ncbi:MAG TPA: Panacea domain-containing protein [Terriglobales bacterium]|nr:Panacea domain-containing protein [Terriglobales bacterium]